MLRLGHLWFHINKGFNINKGRFPFTQNFRNFRFGGSVRRFVIICIFPFGLKESVSYDANPACKRVNSGPHETRRKNSP